ncbi:mitochondrial fission 1 protein isoform X4 [Vidua macroura]|uniref:mitochondrial fission 1 protein isoform X4 n=1 Tax=Vidua macroura TaxID=187451 RepID=UPI0023A88BE7|nr:mitochondrial fission 1 protein isoform X4 [Vidua macroura]
MDPEFDDEVAVEDLMALERRYAAELQQGAPSRQRRFEYGWGLVRSRYREDTARGWSCSPEYERSLAHLERLLAAEPQNAQVLRLRSRVRNRLRRDGLVGAAIVGGVVMGVAGLLGVAIARARH